MNIRHIESFVWLCRLRSFRRTAQRLHITQPAISSRVRALEKELGCTLVDRSANRVAPTPEGRMFLPYAENIVRLYAEAKADLAPQATVRGRVRIGIIDTVTETFLPDLVEGLRARHPGLLLDIVVDSTANLVAQLADDAINIAFTLPRPYAASLNQEPICVFSMAWYASPAVAAGLGTLTKDELEAMPIITYPFGSPPNQMLDRYFDRQESWLAHKSSANSLMTMMRLVADGLGIAAMPPATVLGPVAEGSLVRLETTDPLEPIPIVAVTPAGRDSPATDAIIAMAREVAAAFCAEAPPGLGWVPD